MQENFNLALRTAAEKNSDFSTILTDTANLVIGLKFPKKSEISEGFEKFRENYFNFFCLIKWTKEIRDIDAEIPKKAEISEILCFADMENFTNIAANFCVKDLKYAFMAGIRDITANLNCGGSQICPA